MNSPVSRANSTAFSKKCNLSRGPTEHRKEPKSLLCTEKD